MTRKTKMVSNKLAVFSARNYEFDFFCAANAEYKFELNYFEARLTEQTAELAKNHKAISCFVTDNLNAACLQLLAAGGTEFIALRSAGFNHVDLQAADKLNIKVARVPDYSPFAVAEYAVGLILALNRKIHRAYNKVREHDFGLSGLMGFDLHKKTVGVVGTGKIGEVFAKIMLGFGCEVLIYDLKKNTELLALGAKQVDLRDLYSQANIVSLHCPLNDATRHLLDADAFNQMNPGVMIINTSRGALIDTQAAITALKSGKIGYLGLDVYEEEQQLFFQDHSQDIITDDMFARLQTFPNVIITGHQAFFTKEAMAAIADVTLANTHSFFSNQVLENQVKPCS